jgi:hypothetical protein
MFRHKNSNLPNTTVKTDQKTDEPSVVVTEKKVENAPKRESEVDIRELLEKNLKWSQIIYEQNRKINSKLLWTAIGSWFKVFLILVPLILAALFFAPMAKNLSAMYSDLLMGGVPNTKTTDSLEQVLKLIPLNPAQQEQLKAILK